jgi:hypothetical protein
MEIRIKKIGNCNDVACYLQLYRNTGVEIKSSCFPDVHEEKSPITQCAIGDFYYDVRAHLGINDNKVSLKLIEYAKSYAVDMGAYFAIIVDENEFVYRMHKGVKFGYPEKEVKGLFLPYPKVKFLPDEGMYEYQSFGNRFNGGSTIHATDEFVVEHLKDAQGNPYKTSYSSPGNINGWGCGFKGAFFIIPE